MRYLAYFCGITCVSLTLLSGTGACQEIGPGRLAPLRSTLSPYLNYFVDRNPGILDRYNAYVRPAVDLQQTLVQQNLRIQALGSQIRDTRPPTAGATGIGGAFQNYSHYYSVPRVAVRR